MSRQPSFSQRRRHRGFSLIEVMVSLLVFSFGVLGMVGLQVTATRVSVEASERNRASLMANELVAAMWAAQTTSLSSATLTAWQQRLADPQGTGLYNGTGNVSAPDTDGAVTITITWSSVARGSSGPTARYVTKVALPGAGT